MFSPAAAAPPSAGALAQVEADLAQVSKTLGPNHPQLLALRQRRAMLEEQVVQERRSSSTSVSAAVSAAQSNNSLLETQKAKVMSQRDKVEKVRLMQDEINLRRDQYTKAIARGAELRQEADISESGVIPLANAITPQDPVFPKKGLVISAALFGGAGLGVAIGLLIELLGRRIRSADDLHSAIDAPILAVIRRAGKPLRTSWLSRLLRPIMPRPRAAGA